MSEKISHKLVDSHLFEWSVYSAPVKTELYSHALRSDGKIILIDPVMPDAATLTEIKKLGNVAAIFLTSGNHERATPEIAKALQVPVAASALASRDFNFKPDIVVDGLKQIYGVVPIPMSGAGNGEYAYYATDTRTLVLGDAIFNTPTGLMLLPEKYCTNLSQLKTSLTQLSALDITWLAFAHGTTIKNPLPQLKPFLAL